MDEQQATGGVTNDAGARAGRICRIASVIASLVGLAASAALLAPKVVGRGFCGAGGGCDRVAQSAYATLFGIPRTVLGVVAFVALIFMVTAGAPGVRKVAPFVGAVFVAEGLHLLALQAFVIGAWCPFCVVIDVSSIVAGALLIVDRLPRLRSVGALRPLPIALAAAAALGAPIGIAAARAPATGPIAKVEDGTGKRVLREFVDLECPYCRMTHAALKKELAGRPDVIVERKHVPLSFHKNAFAAAVAACCAGEQGKEDGFVDGVIAKESPPDAETCMRVAKEVGLDLAQFEACRASDRPTKRIAADEALASAVKVEGLPTIDFDGERHVGALDEKSAKALLARHR